MINDLAGVIPDGLVGVVILGVLTLFVTLNGVVFDIKRDPSKDASFNNLSTKGKFFIGITVLLGGFGGYKQWTDAREQESVLIDSAKREKKLSKQLEGVKVANTKLSEQLGDIREDNEKHANDLSRRLDLASRQLELAEERANKLEVITNEIGVQSADALGVQQEHFRVTKELQLSQHKNVQILNYLYGKATDVQKATSTLQLKDNYVDVSFDALVIGENCELGDELGQFHYKLYANGKVLQHDTGTLLKPILIPDNDKAENLGTVHDIPVKDRRDKLLLAGYVRERDDKNWLGRWTYKYDGQFSTEVSIEEGKDTIKIISEEDCNVSLEYSTQYRSENI